MEDKESCQNDGYVDRKSVPTKMQLFSTWEVRKIPANCVSRLCTVVVTRLEVLKPIEPGTSSVVLAVSMKTPHRSLRSNEIELQSNGLLDIPLELTFSLQYPHFLKRGGNTLQIKIQRRKRYRQRAIGGYKTLVAGNINMAQVLQHSFQGVVKLFSEKATEHVALVTVRSLTSVAMDIDSRLNMGSSDEEDDEIFSDDLVEDTDSGEAEQPGFDVSPHGRSHKAKRRTKGSQLTSAAMLSRLLKFNRRGKNSIETELDPEVVEDRESAVAFVSSASDSQEEDELLDIQRETPPQPTLTPFFSSDRLSMVSLPLSSQEAKTMWDARGGWRHETPQIPESPSLSKRYASLEEAISGGLDESPPPSMLQQDHSLPDFDMLKGRLWVVAIDNSEAITSALGDFHEPTLVLEPLESKCVGQLKSLLLCLHQHWHKSSPFHVILLGSDCLVSLMLQAVLALECSPDRWKATFIPAVPGVLSMRFASMDERYHTAISTLDQQSLLDNLSPVLQYVSESNGISQLPIASAFIYKATSDPSSGEVEDPVYSPFIFSVSVGALEADTEQASSPTSPPLTSECPELVVEYWTGKGQKTNIKVRSVLMNCNEQGLNITALSKDKKGKGIKVRKKDSFIISLTSIQVVCKPVNKQEAMTVVVDGTEWTDVNIIKLTYSGEQNIFPVAICT